MRVVGLISGGKDSIYSLMKCVEHGHTIVALAHLKPPPGIGEMDSWMYQTTASNGTEAIAAAMDLPLFVEEIKGIARNTTMEYVAPSSNDEQSSVLSPTTDDAFSPSATTPAAAAADEGEDEVEDLYRLLLKVKNAGLHVDAVSSGAVLSDYQRVRVENVCSRLSLVSLAYLWQRKQDELLADMIAARVNAIVVKVACMELPETQMPKLFHKVYLRVSRKSLDGRALGKTIVQLSPTFHKLHDQFGCHICGEGGEYETFTLDCPLFRKKIVIDTSHNVEHSADDVAPVIYLVIDSYHLEDKTDPPPPVSAVETISSSLSSTPPPPTPPPTTNAVTSPPPPPSMSLPLQWGGVGEEGEWSFFPLSATEPLGGDGEGVEEASERIMETIKAALRIRRMSWRDVLFVSIVLPSMSAFASFNAIYKRHVPPIAPPARACVASKNSPLSIEIVAFKHSSASHSTVRTVSVHVQSTSEWAPANIGPYSQAKKFGNLVFVAGQIGLIPATMALAADFDTQVDLALSHTKSILAAQNLGTPATVFFSTIFVVDQSRIEDASSKYREWMSENSSSSAPSLVACVAVSELPRMSQFEILSLALDGEEAGKIQLSTWNPQKDIRCEFGIIPNKLCVATAFLASDDPSLVRQSLPSIIEAAFLRSHLPTSSLVFSRVFVTQKTLVIDDEESHLISEVLVDALPLGVTAILTMFAHQALSKQDDEEDFD